MPSPQISSVDLGSVAPATGVLDVCNTCGQVMPPPKSPADSLNRAEAVEQAAIVAKTFGIEDYATVVPSGRLQDGSDFSKGQSDAGLPVDKADTKRELCEWLTSSKGHDSPFPINLDPAKEGAALQQDAGLTPAVAPSAAVTVDGNAPQQGKERGRTLQQGRQRGQGREQAPPTPESSNIANAARGRPKADGFLTPVKNLGIDIVQSPILMALAAGWLGVSWVGGAKGGIIGAVVGMVLAAGMRYALPHRQ